MSVQLHVQGASALASLVDWCLLPERRPALSASMHKTACALACRKKSSTACLLGQQEHMAMRCAAHQGRHRQPQGMGSPAAAGAAVSLAAEGTWASLLLQLPSRAASMV